MRFLCAGLALWLALSGASAAQEPSNRSGLAVARVAAALDNITAINRPGRVGYATVWDGNKYVQCRRLTDRAMRCEAAGAAMQPSLAPVFTGERLNAIAALGWRLDPAFGNYVRSFDAATPTNEIAAQVVRVLADGYGSEPADLERNTAWIEDVPCPPRSGPTQNLAGSVNGDEEMIHIRACAYAGEPAAPQKVDSAGALVARSGAMVVAELDRLRINAQRHVFVIFGAGIGYVQCAPESDDVLYCEAQSPESWPALNAIITPQRLARLHEMGYADPGRAPNYWKQYKFAAGTDTIAVEILTLLYDVYGYDGATPLEVTAR